MLQMFTFLVSNKVKNAMVEAIRKEALDIVFMWTQCPETYSYVYYEMSINGVYVLTNTNSGNIRQRDQKKKME